MAYTKQNFVDQQVLTASHLNHIESGIVALDSGIEELSNGIDSSIAVLDGEITELNNAKIEIKLLWENASPTSNFSAQTISLDLSDADMVMIKFKAQASSTSTTRNNAFGFVGEQIPLVGYLNLGAGSNTAEFSYRLATISTTEIAFGKGYKKSTGSSATGEEKTERSTPVEIYTIKGVQK